MVQHIRPRHHCGALLAGDNDGEVAAPHRGAAPQKLIEREAVEACELCANRVVVVADVRYPRARLRDEVAALKETELLLGPKDGEVVKVGRQNVIERLEERVAALHPFENVHDHVVMIRGRELVLDLLQLSARRGRARRRVGDEALERNCHDLCARRHRAARVHAAHVRLVAL